MISSDYLAFLPLLIYGIALTELFSQWKRLINLERMFIPYSLFTIILTEMAIYNVYVYGNLVVQLEGLNYYFYLKYLIPPLLFILTINIFTPDKDSDTKDYFLKKVPIFFTLLSLFVACHFLFDFDENLIPKVGRIVAIILILITGIYRKIWLMYIIFFWWLILLPFRGLIVFT